jgi:hypothetical protein
MSASSEMEIAPDLSAEALPKAEADVPVASEASETAGEVVAGDAEAATETEEKS